MSEPTQTTKRLVAARQRYRCWICNKDLTGPTPHSFHHRRMRSHPFPGLHEPANLILLCGTGTTGCHGQVHADPAHAYRNGWLMHSWQPDPEASPLLDHDGRWRLLDNTGQMFEYPREHHDTERNRS